MYTSPHITHFKEWVKPIEALLVQQGEVKWTEACTAALNDLLSCIYARIRLVPADTYGKLVLYPTVHKDTVFGACLQNGAPVAFVSCHMSKIELKYGILTRLVALVAWAEKRLRRYTTFASDI